MVRVWIKECRYHDECVTANEDTNDKQVLPSRLLHIRPGSVVSLCRTPQQRPRYAALSHCWGNKPSLQTTANSLRKHEQGIEWESLSRTFQDAITLARALGLHYLWIDSLCIIQDSASDWEAESSRTGRIYNGAEITIAASKAPDGSAGLFTDRAQTPYIWRRGGLGLDVSPQYQKDTEDPHDPTYIAVSHPGQWSPYPITTGNGRTFWMALEPTHEILEHRRRRPPADIDALGMPLFTRAWYLQERLMSTRVIHFGAMELYWECNRGMWCECVGDVESNGSYSEMTARKLFSRLCHHSNESRDDTPPNEHHRTAVIWHKLVEEYTRLRLTRETDRLPALSGIANMLGGTYLAGLLTAAFPCCLYWTTNTTCNVLCRRPTSYRAPSFSWASVEGPIDYHDWSHELMPISQSHPRSVAARLIDTGSVAHGLDPSGRVTSGHITVRAYCGTAKVQSIYSDGIITWCNVAKGDMRQSFILDIPFYVALDEPAEVLIGETVVLLLLECARQGDKYQCAVMVLKEVGQEMREYRRVGLIGPTIGSSAEFKNLETDAPRWFEGAREICIV